MVLPPSQVLGAEYLADDRVRVVQVAHGHDHFPDHAQLFARHLGQVHGVGTGGDERVAGARRRRAVGLVQPEIVHGTDGLQPGRRVRPVALVRRTLVPVRVDLRVGLLGRHVAATTAAGGHRRSVFGHDGHGGGVVILVRRHRAAATHAARAARAALAHRRVRPQVVHRDRTAHRVVVVVVVAVAAVRFIRLGRRRWWCWCRRLRQ